MSERSIDRGETTSLQAVYTTRLDDHFSSYIHLRKSIFIIKVDVEEAELEVLEGALALFK